MDTKRIAGSKKFKFVEPRAIVEPTKKWIRVKLAGETVGDSKRALLLIEYGPGKLPTYCFPVEDVRMDLLDEQKSREGADRMFYTVKAGGKVVEDGAWIYEKPEEGLEAIRGYVIFDWEKMDEWYEESEQVFVHARDPYKRVDVQMSSRRVRVEVNGVSLADSDRGAFLFETSLPTRYYLPKEDVRVDLLEESNASSECPYKGKARYWNVNAGGEVIRNLVWCYEEPIVECAKIKGMVCFFNERVDIWVDGELEERPITPWSR